MNTLTKIALLTAAIAAAGVTASAGMVLADNYHRNAARSTFAVSCRSC